jgi:Tol biopolymer transport system component/pimeloyl-ACP methyl ester carboxylesterase
MAQLFRHSEFRYGATMLAELGSKVGRLTRLFALGFFTLASALVGAQTTELVSRSMSGGFGDNDSGTYGAPVQSADGRYVAFTSAAYNLVAGDTNNWDIFVRDRKTGTTERVSVDISGGQANGNSGGPGISADGRYVTFYSYASNLVGGDTNGVFDIFVRDRIKKTTERISINSIGGEGNFNSLWPVISGDGRFVAFQSDATNLVPNDLNNSTDIFVRDRILGTTERVSLSSSGQEGNAGCYWLSINFDGRYVAFQSYASNLVPGDTNTYGDVFVRDRLTSQTEQISVDRAGRGGNEHSYEPSISADGRYVAFGSYASTLVARDGNGTHDIFVRDRQTKRTERISVGAKGGDASGGSYWPMISADGQSVAFISDATNLVVGDSNGRDDVFVRDRVQAKTELVSVDSVGGQGNGPSFGPSISANGRLITFFSDATNLAPGDIAGWRDVFARDRGPLFPTIPLSLNLTPSTVPWGATVSATITFSNPVPNGGGTVRFTVNSDALPNPDPVNVKQGQTSLTINIQTRYVTANTSATLTASAGAASSSATVKILARSEKIDPKSVLLQDSSGRPMDGIVCDNSAAISKDDLDRLNLVLDPSIGKVDSVTIVDSDSGPPVAGRGTITTGSNGSIYYPPMEFNFERDQPTSWDDVTSADSSHTNIRPITLRVLIKALDGTFKAAFRSVLLARTPVILVHGINNNAPNWLETIIKVARKLGTTSQTTYSSTYTAPVVSMSHADLPGGGDGMSGRGTLEAAARQLALAIDEVKADVSGGLALPADANYPSRVIQHRDIGTGYLSKWDPWTTWKGKKLAIRRVDLIGHSYGGMVCRWYVANRPADSESRKWYLAGTPGRDFAAPLRTYGGDVRKLVTFASMWRGVPLCNELTECAATANETNPFGNAPINTSFNGFREWIERLPKPYWPAPPSIGSVFLPTYQVMAVESPWLRQMLYGTPTPAPSVAPTPFVESVCYGSVAGTSSDYIEGVIDLYDEIRSRQQPSWFPYPSLEVARGKQLNYQDGIVPLWSAALPGSDGLTRCLVNESHSDVITSEPALQYAFCMLSSIACVDGKRMNGFWQNSNRLGVGVSAQESGYQWKFPDGAMIPSTHVAAYANVGGVGRLNPEAVRERGNIKIRYAGRDKITFAIKCTRSFHIDELDVWSGIVKRDRTGDVRPKGKNADGWFDFDVIRKWDKGTYTIQPFWKADDVPAATEVYLDMDKIQVIVP